ncbi:immunoglobulin domain-containing protein [uncultured Butyricimonas sp.]|uniref:immunoglobulin domain-containing protein n=1 Tax=uncultured Butyricimonas sp. TaxID=1268785 RepID=UPI0026DAD075|nr:immunoglobulin domain-containing protein [uncultured Butyricimonas sp.]
MKRRIIFILFVILTGFSGENGGVEQSNIDVLGSASVKGGKPKIVQRLVGQMVHEGDKATFIAKLETSDRQCTVIWYKNAIQIKESDRFHLSFNGETAKLEINPVEVTDKGEYKVEFKNEYGKDESSAPLAVIKFP